MRNLIKLASSATVTVLAAFSLTGCIPQSTPTLEPLPPVTNPQTPPATPTPTLTTTPSPENPTPFSIPCNSVVDAQTMYDFNPNFGLLDSFTPSANSLAEQALNLKGTACRWINQTSGDVIDVSISRPGPKALASAKTQAQSGSTVSGLGDSAYFSVQGNFGTIQVFKGDFWITATSAFFSSASDADPIISVAIAAAK
ncbi:MAG: arginyl-tRNA synthetase [Microbacteriaceae bacterium]|nr:arginyl-tRNA synthetase [Microbacteriaceae bacterium]